MLLYKESALTLSAVLSDSVLGIANVIYLSPCVVGGLKGIWEAVERYRHFMHGRDGGDLPTHEAAHSEMSRAGIFAAVENYRLFMQGRDGGDLPTFEAAHSAMSRAGFSSTVEDTRIALEECVSGEVTNESSRSVRMAICGNGNTGKPRSALCFHPSTITMIEQYADQEFVTPVSDSRGRINKVFSPVHGDICYALSQWGVVKSTKVAVDKISSWIDQANANDGQVKYVDIPIKSRKHNHGEVYYVRFTVLSDNPLDVRIAPKRPDSDKKKSQNKVIVHEDSGGDGDGGLTISFAQVPLIKATRKVLKDANTKEEKKKSNWSEFKANAATYKKRTEAEAKDANTNTEKKKKKTRWSEYKMEAATSKKVDEELFDSEAEEWLEEQIGRLSTLVEEVVFDKDVKKRFHPTPSDFHLSLSEWSDFSTDSEWQVI
jgi:hypothetical protein